jgi:NAD(P)-dependent dehydrogenase (short-subunit alcohol dehydrogenase family)
MRLRDKVAVVTGSTRGIGEAIARLFYKEGAKVVISGRDEAAGQAIADQLAKDEVNAKFSDKGPRCIFVKFDVSVKKDVLRLKENTLSYFGAVDILVNNAGAQGPFPMEKITEEAWDRIMDIDLKGTFYCSQIFGEQMIKQKTGVILNMASISAHYAYPDGGAYGPAKSATIMLTKQCAMEWAKHNIRVNSISPGLIRTPLSENIYQDEAVTQARIEMIPMRRIGTPEDVAYTTLFLCSDESSYITGQDILVDGGITDNIFQKIPGRAKIKEKFN